MFLNEKQREHLVKLSQIAKHLSNALRDTSQWSERGHFTANIAFDSATILSDQINAGLEMFIGDINKIDIIVEDALHETDVVIDDL